jgi:hypothetical protein
MGKDNVVADALPKIEEASSYIPLHLPSLCGWKKLTMNDKKAIELEKQMSKKREALYGTLGVEERYPLVQGYNIVMPSIKVEETNIKGVL